MIIRWVRLGRKISASGSGLYEFGQFPPLFLSDLIMHEMSLLYGMFLFTRSNLRSTVVIGEQLYVLL